MFSIEFPQDDTPFYNPNEDIEMTRRKVPHWFQEGKLQFITYRLNDSLPVVERERIKQNIQLFKTTHPEPWDESTKKLYATTFPKQIEKLMDKGYGDCWLKRRDCQEIIVDSFLHRDGQEYKVYNFVIMPNHLHLLMEFDSPHEPIIRSIRRYTATRINRIVDRKGELWNEIIWDTLVRNESHYNACINYINNNPRHLPEGEFYLYDWKL